MSKHGASDATDRALRDAGKDGVAEFGKEAGADPGETVCGRRVEMFPSVSIAGSEQESGKLRTADDDSSCDGERALAGGRVDFNVEGVDDALEKERDLDVQELKTSLVTVSVCVCKGARVWAHLSSDQETEGEQDSTFRTPVLLGPDIWQELFDDVPIPPRLLLIADGVFLADVGRDGWLFRFDRRRFRIPLGGVVGVVFLLLVPFRTRVSLRCLARCFRQFVFPFSRFLLLRLRCSCRRLGRVGIAGVVGVRSGEGEDR